MAVRRLGSRLSRRVDYATAPTTWARSENGEVYTPLREGRAAWPAEAFESDVAELRGVRVRVISVRALTEDKSDRRDDPRVAAKDRADLATLGATRPVGDDD